MHASMISVAALLLATAAQAATPATAHSDLNGVWSNASVTQLNRPASATALVISEAEAKAMAAANGNVRRAQADAKPSNLNVNTPSNGDVGGYNAGWLDPGMTVAKVNGQYRTSWIVEPANGQAPLTDAGRALQRQAGARSNNMTPEGPEALAPNDRCIISSRGSGGPGMLNNLYNNTYQIVVSRDAVVIEVEMVHDARIIPLFATKALAQAGHRPEQIRPWLGDSVGWWEGEALVVETSNINPDQGAFGPIFLSAKGVVTERFTRYSADQITYSFEVADPVYYTQTWKAEMGLNKSPGLIYEYACHEGNYAMEGILTGARAAEAKVAGAK